MLVHNSSFWGIVPLDEGAQFLRNRGSEFLFWENRATRIGGSIPEKSRFRIPVLGGIVPPLIPIRSAESGRDVGDRNDDDGAPVTRSDDSAVARKSHSPGSQVQCNENIIVDSSLF